MKRKWRKREGERHLTQSEYLKEINEASREIYIWFKENLPNGKKDEAWYEGLMNDLGKLLEKYKGKLCEGYAFKYGVACLDELEEIETGKRTSSTIAHYGQMDGGQFLEYLAGYPQKGDSVTVTVGDRKIGIRIGGEWE